MTEEQFNEAVRINERLEKLKKVKEEIEGISSHVLSYCEKRLNGDIRPCAEWKLRVIADILDKHDSMIRQEIEDEIEKLRNKIEEI